MTRTRVRGWLLGLIVVALPVQRARAEEAQSQPYVLLIGVSQYSDKQIKPRPHAEADAKALYDLFTHKDYLGVKADHIRLLLGQADAERKSEPATHENILKAIRWLAAEPQRDDLVILAFIGQGASLGDAGNRLCYLAADSTLKDRSKNAVAAADIGQELDKLKSRRFCALIDVHFRGFDKGPEKVADATLGETPYKEFRGPTVKEDESSAPGRVVFLATNGLTPSLDLEKHGLFTQALLDGLQGAADKEGYGPDGLVTVDELWEYLNKEMPERARKVGKTDEEKRQTPHVLESVASHFVLTRNPAMTTKVADRLAKLAQLGIDQKISPELAAEGKSLLSRMPKLKAYQDLRRDYERLVDGTLSVDEFKKARSELQAAMKIKRSSAFEYASKVIQATIVIKENYVKKVEQGDLVAWAIRGLYRQIEEKIPADVRERLDKVRSMTEPEMTALLADVRERLGQRDDLDNHKDIDYSLQQMLRHLDPYTTYIDQDTLARFTTETTGKFTGIGISIRENRTRGMLQVISPLKDSPAYKAGLKAGDLISSITRYVDNEGKPLSEPEVISTKGMTTSDAVKKIQGKPRTKIKLTVEREGEEQPLEFEVERTVIEIESVMGVKRLNNDEWDYLLDADNKIAYVRLTNFARNTARDLRRVLAKLDKGGINGLILDLRFNPGGLLTSAVDICEMFLPVGDQIVTIRPRQGRPASYQVNRADKNFVNFPMVCLVNGSSASGSEIVSACLQDHERAIVVGERSYGKGSVQNIQPFEGGELKLTTASFWRPSGKNLNKSSTSGKDEDEWGVTPNKGYLVRLSEREREQLAEQQREAEIISRRDVPSKEKKTESKDRQLEKALDYLRGQIRIAVQASVKKAG